MTISSIEKRDENQPEWKQRTFIDSSLYSLEYIGLLWTFAEAY